MAGRATRVGKVGGAVVPAVVGGAVLALGGLAWTFLRQEPRILGHEVVRSFPHDPAAYTQGLLWHDGALYESTGRRGTSTVRRVTLETGAIEKQTTLPTYLFGEGLALHGGRLYQLSWTSGECRVYDPQTLAYQETLIYEGEGWGLSAIGGELVMSDGTDLLSFRDPRTFEETRRVRVRDGKRKVVRVNELEYITKGPYAGELWANVWKAMQIARIDPKSGAVKGWVDLTGVFDPRSVQDEDAVLNGIAFDPVEVRYFVTGKLWPRLFQIRPVKP